MSRTYNAYCEETEKKAYEFLEVLGLPREYSAEILDYLFALRGDWFASIADLVTYAMETSKLERETGTPREALWFGWTDWMEEFFEENDGESNLRECWEHFKAVARDRDLSVQLSIKERTPWWRRRDLVRPAGQKATAAAKQRKR